MLSARQILNDKWAEGRPYGQCPCCHLKEVDFPTLEVWNFHVERCTDLFFARCWAIKLAIRHRYHASRKEYLRHRKFLTGRRLAA